MKLVQAVAETNSLTRAAEQLYVSQSALSHQLREIETELGTPLFIRSSRKMVLTPAGERLLATANHILCELEKAESSIRQLNSEDAGKLRLTTGCYTCYHWLSPVLLSYRREFPRVEIEIVPEATSNPIEHLLEGRLDMVLTSDREDPVNVRYEPLFDDKLVAILAPTHPLAALKVIPAGTFETETLVMYNVHDQNSTILNEFLKPAGIRPKKTIRLPLTEAILEMVKAELGIGILAEWAIKPYLERGELIALPIKPAVRRTWYAASLKEMPVPRYLNAFLELLKIELPVRMCCAVNN